MLFLKDAAKALLVGVALVAVLWVSSDYVAGVHTWLPLLWPVAGIVGLVALVRLGKHKRGRDLGMLLSAALLFVACTGSMFRRPKWLERGIAPEITKLEAMSYEQRCPQGEKTFEPSIHVGSSGDCHRYCGTAGEAAGVRLLCTTSGTVFTKFPYNTRTGWGPGWD